MGWITLITLPVVGLTIGDPAGIGPEISVRAAVSPDVLACARPVLIGDFGTVETACRVCGIAVPLERLAEIGQADWGRESIKVLAVDGLRGRPVEYGRVQEAAGEASFACIQRAVSLAREGQIAAIVTAPINKESIKAAGVPFIGHTEMLADMTGVHDEMTMFVIENVRIFFLSRHVPLIEACRLAGDPEFVHDGIVRSYRALEESGFSSPRLAVAGLNPHAGEGGLLGQEEIKAIRPAVERAKAAGMKVTGPVPADSVFHLARLGRFDAVLSLYHDQGHIASKMMDFEKTVSVTLGLPILRTSVDHGTAFDIAGKGIASPVSMIEAVKVAAALANRRG